MQSQACSDQHRLNSAACETSADPPGQQAKELCCQYFRTLTQNPAGDHHAASLLAPSLYILHFLDDILHFLDKVLLVTFNFFLFFRFRFFFIEFQSIYLEISHYHYDFNGNILIKTR